MNCMIYLMLKIENFNFKMRFFSFFFMKGIRKGRSVGTFSTLERTN